MPNAPTTLPQRSHNAPTALLQVLLQRSYRHRAPASHDAPVGHPPPAPTRFQICSHKYLAAHPLEFDTAGKYASTALGAAMKNDPAALPPVFACSVSALPPTSLLCPSRRRLVKTYPTRFPLGRARLGRAVVFVCNFNHHSFPLGRGSKFFRNLHAPAAIPPRSHFFRE